MPHFIRRLVRGNRSSRSAGVVHELDTRGPTTNRWPWRLVCLALLLVIQSRAQAQDRAETSGLSLGLGAGHPSGGLGANAYYYLQLPSERWRLAAHVGVGVIGYVTVDGEKDGRVGVAGGLMAAYGRRHRLIMDVLAAPFGAEGSIGGEDEHMRLYYGVGALVGYEFMARYGLNVRAGLGIGYCPDRGRRAGEVGLALDLVSVGYKFW